MENTWLYVLIISAFAEFPLNHAAKWSYSGDTGATKWHELFPEACSGKHQSPIDIRHDETVYNPDLKDFAIFYDPPKPDSKMYIKNNGHTIQVDLEGDFYITNGGLSNVYRALQFHFHWGDKVHHGSEHLFDGEASPIEMHLVTYNHETFSDISEAVVTRGGLAVLGTMYEISEEDNPNLATVVKALKHIRDPEAHEKVALPLMSLRDFLPKDISRYYRYNGSLTTPGCFESVTWTLFEQKQTISHSQLKEFTKVLQSKHFHKMNKHGHKHGEDRHRRSLSRTRRELEHRAQDVLYELGIKGDHYEEAVLKSELLYIQMMADSPQDSTVIEKTESDDEEKKDDEEHTKHGEKNIEDISEEDVKSDKTADDQIEEDVKHHEEDVKHHEEDVKHHAEGDKHHEEDAHDHEDEASNKEKETGNPDENDDINNSNANHEEKHVEGHKDEEKVVEVMLEEEIYTQEVMVNNFRPVQPINDRVVYRSFEIIEPISVQDDFEFERSQFAKSVNLDEGYDGRGNAAGCHRVSMLSAVIALIVMSFFM